MSVLQKLTEGIVSRDLGKEGAALLTKWERTGLLEGLNNDHTRSSMARLLENQAKELLREVSSMAGGDMQGATSGIPGKTRYKKTKNSKRKRKENLEEEGYIADAEEWIDDSINYLKGELSRAKAQRKE